MGPKITMEKNIYIYIGDKVKGKRKIEVINFNWFFLKIHIVRNGSENSFILFCGWEQLLQRNQRVAYPFQTVICIFVWVIYFPQGCIEGITHTQTKDKESPCIWGKYLPWRGNFEPTLLKPLDKQCLGDESVGVSTMRMMEIGMNTYYQLGFSRYFQTLSQGFDYVDENMLWVEKGD